MTTHKILVIDDSMVIRRTVKDMLPEGKFEVIEAKDGLKGMELIETGNPNLIMLDFFLPKMSGWDVYLNIQKEPRYRAIPLLLMSGRKDEVTEKITEPFEFFSFLEKPFDQKQLIQGIRDAMEKSKKLSDYLKASTPTPVSQVTAATQSQDSNAMANEIKALKTKVAQMEGEITQLKKQLNQIVTFIKQKLK